MLQLQNLVEFIFSIALFINGLLFIPQAIKLHKARRADDVSLTTFLGFLLIQLIIVAHGFLKSDYTLLFGYLFSSITCSIVVILIIVNKIQK